MAMPNTFAPLPATTEPRRGSAPGRDPRPGLADLDGWIVGAGLIGLLLGGVALVYVTGGTGRAWLHVLYVPILLAAVRFGARGALVMALACGLAVGPLMPIDVAAGTPQQAVNWLFRIGLFLVVGAVAGASWDAARSRHEALAASESRFRSLVHHGHDVIVVHDPDEVVTYASPSVERVLGHRPEALLGLRLDRLVAADDLQGLRAGPCRRQTRVSRPGHGRSTPGLASADVRFRHADGSWRHLRVLVTDLRDDPAVAGIVLNGYDVTERRAVEAELLHRAMHDPLTGFLNRATFTRRLGERFDHGDAREQGLAVVLLSVDRLHSVNDAYGYAGGDRLIASLAARLRERVADEDRIGRYGIGEFAVVEPGITGPAHAAEVAERLRDLVREPFTLGDEEVYLTLSAGAAVLEGQHDADRLVSDAYLALREAKRGGGHRSAVYRPHLRGTSEGWRRTESALHRALREGELRAHFQPVVRMPAAQTTGFEALVRWQHPHLGLVPPNEFIPIAEQTGLIAPIGVWMLDEACRWLARWRREHVNAGALRMGVNVSTRQLEDPGFVDTVGEALTRHDLPPSCLSLEVTETSVISDMGTSGVVLRRLREAGVEVAVDDFGTGYSSLGYLQQLPVDAIKIDRTFVRKLSLGSHDPIVSAVIGLARSLGLRTIAEGVETEEQSAALLALGCPDQQGFLFGRPVAPETLRLDGLLRGRQLASH